MEKEVRVNGVSAQYSAIVALCLGGKIVDYTEKYGRSNKRVDFQTDVFTDKEMTQKVDSFRSHIGSEYSRICACLNSLDYHLLFDTLRMALDEAEKGNEINLSFDPETEEIVIRLKETDAPGEGAPVGVTECE